MIKLALTYAVITLILKAITIPLLTVFDINTVEAYLYTGTSIGTLALLLAQYFNESDEED